MNLSHIEISMFENCVSTLGRTVSLLTVLNAIKQGRWREEVERIRHLYDAELKRSGSYEKAKKAVEHLKKALPGVTWSGRFSRRGNEYLLQYSRLFGADIDVDALVGKDLKEVRARLQTSPHVVAISLSPTGYGLKVIFKVIDDAQQHLGSFRAVEQLILDLTGVQIAESGKDVARLCFVSFDPDLYINPNAQEITPLPLSPKPAAQTGVASLTLRQREAVGLLGQVFDWQSETSGYLPCPGKHLHTTGDAERDCEIHLDGAPTLHCFHNHCRGILDALNRELRSRIGKAEFANTKSAGEGKDEQPSHPSRNVCAAPELQKDIQEAQKCGSSSTDEETLSRLAAKPELEYERIREAEAKRLSCRAGALDKLVEARRQKKPSHDTLQGQL